jgi:hypothetical protein
MSTLQRVSRGFHRLGLLLAAIPLLIGGAFTIGEAMEAMEAANRASREHQRVICAHQYLRQIKKRRLTQEAKPPPISRDVLLAPDDTKINLRSMGCSSSDDTISLGEARNPPEFSWLGAFVPPTAALLGLTLAVSLAVYGLVRAIGWVVGGFTAS